MVQAGRVTQSEPVCQVRELQFHLSHKHRGSQAGEGLSSSLSAWRIEWKMRWEARRPVRRLVKL